MSHRSTPDYAAVAGLLAIACFNVANLLLARSASHRREIAIRTSLGAGRLAIIRQWLVESLLLAVVGGALGIALARLSLDALMAFAPPDLLRVPELFVDRRVLLYALGLSLLTGVVVGIVPALLAARQSIVASIRSGGLSVTHSPRIRQALVVSQVAMTVVLLSGAGLLVRTVIALNATDNGFDKQADNPYLPIIGVVGDVSEGSVRDSAQPTVFYSHRQMPENAMTLFVRARQPGAVAAAAVGEIRRLDPNLAVTRIRTVEGAFAESVARERLNAMVSGAFALSGLLLAAFGLYGLLALMVNERTKELGIRLALGEQLGQLRRSVVVDGLRLVGIGAAAGLFGSFVFPRSLSALLFGVAADDFPTYLVVLILLGVIAVLASYFPARRAAQVEPLVALRQD